MSFTFFFFLRIVLFKRKSYCATFRGFRLGWRGSLSHVRQGLRIKLHEMPNHDPSKAIYYERPLSQRPEIQTSTFSPYKRGGQKVAWRNKELVPGVIDWWMSIDTSLGWPDLFYSWQRWLCQWSMMLQVWLMRLPWRRALLTPCFSNFLLSVFS